MTGRTKPADCAPRSLMQAVAAEAAEHGRTWFPELRAGPLRVRFRSGWTRSRCLLFRLDLCDDLLTRPLVVKVRHSDPALRRPDRFAQRPVLAPVRTLPDTATARREFDGLALIQSALGERHGLDRRFGAIRPLAWLPEHSAFVTDYVGQPTLRTVFLRTSRLRLRRASPLPDRPWENAGAWLRIFHDHPTTLPLSPRADRPAGVGDLLSRFADFLVDRLGGHPLLRELSGSGTDVADAALPPALPLGTGHGDFVANNMFLSREGRITVFDPLPMWRVPVYQDLATMVVGLRMVSSQAMSRGLAFPSPQLQRFEGALYRGYFGDRPPPRTTLHVFQLLVLLDRWSSLVSRRSRHRGVRPHLRDARVRVISHHYETEAHRLARQVLG